MSSTTQTSDDRINLRLQRQAKQMLERAASFEGKTVSKFILSCAMERAEQTIQEHDMMTLTRNDSEAFFNALSAPVEFNDKLAAAIEEHDQRVTSK